ncbi:MAG: AIR synthase-related protein [Bacteroidales bacterium]|nr:AIR synthase-related protein [Bacteroidales bacterium]
MNLDKYEKRGVSSQKEDVHKAISNLDKGLYENTFCKILPNIFEPGTSNVVIMHADGAGTKSSLAYLYWKETGDINVWKGLVCDALYMNIDDMMCSGALGPFVVSSTIGRNKGLITGDIISTIINEFNEQCQWLTSVGIPAILAGGETADVGDLVRTIIIDSTVYSQIKKENVIQINIQPGDVIVALASYGKASYEKEYNSGIGSNGLTFARHEVLYRKYAQQYPETYDSNIDEEYIYTGKYKVTDVEPETKLSVGKLLLSPTRTYVPILKDIFKQYRDKIHGIIHCTGGGQTKVLNFTKNIHIIKENLLPIPPVFRLIQSVSNSDWKEMFRVFNMGHRLEIYTDLFTAEQIIKVSQQYNIDAKIIGHCQPSNENKLTIKYNQEEYTYIK